MPKGVAVSSLDEVKKAIQEVFPNESEVIYIHKLFQGLVLNQEHNFIALYSISSCFMEEYCFLDTVGR